MQTGKADKRRYAWDKPSDCAYCYFWNKLKGCKKKECYYLLPEKAPLSTGGAAQMPDCRGCPYGRSTPCIGFCLQKIILEMKQKRQDNRKAGGQKNAGRSK